MTRLLFSVLAGVLADLYYPIPGMLIAGVVFPGGVHSNFAMTWFFASYVVNFLLAAGMVYALSGAIARAATCFGVARR